MNINTITPINKKVFSIHFVLIPACRDTIRKRLGIFLLSFLFIFPASAYDDGIRIAWDYNQRVFHNTGTYARIKKLQNNDLVLVYSAGATVYIRKQLSGTKTWNTAVQVASNADYTYTNAELIELQNGTLIYAWNARPKDGTNRPYKIMIKFSTDAGNTWNSEQDIYTAGTIADDGCWEPYFLQLPSGELQIYFANENIPAVSNRYQNITMIRSFDNGDTWQSPEIISYRNGSRDGMPVSVYLQNQKGIAMAIEDNGINGAFKPVIVHTAADDNWTSGTVYGNSSKRWHALRSDYQLSSGVYGGAPYLIQLTSGETVIAFQSQEGRTNGNSHEYANLQVYIGNDEAKNFSRKSTPFPYIASGAQALWNSLCQTTDSTVLAVASLNGLSENNGVWSVTGKILQPMESPRSHTVNRDWSKPKALFVGSESRASMKIKSMWDNDSLYFFFDVNDIRPTIADEGSALWDTDGIEVYLDINNINTGSLATGLQKILVNINNQTLIHQSSGSQWVDWAPGLNYKVSLSQYAYTIEISIPWSDLGGKPANPFGVHFKLHNNNGGTTTITHDNLSGGNPDRPRTWLKCTLLDSPPSSDKNIQVKENKLTIYPTLLKRGQSFHLSIDEELTNAEITVYDAVSGRTLYKTMLHEQTHTIPGIAFSGTGIVVVNTNTGKRYYNKIIMN